uniref:Gamma-glutamyl hydrolase n=1 Tax=Gouania willdenowi TaxID=441366 RepID=A0A8C5H634_GOUWI
MYSCCHIVILESVLCILVIFCVLFCHFVCILTQLVVDESMKPYGKTYIPASYVEYVQSGGSRVMPIRLDFTQDKYETIFKKINGLLLIGGAVDLETSDFAKVAKIFYKLALKANDAGDFFPIWGTCLGMQLLTVLVAEKNLLTATPAENLSLPLDLTQEADTSRMFSEIPHELRCALTKEPLTGNFHHYGLEVKNFNASTKLRNFFSVLSTNVANNGVHFVSTVEGQTWFFFVGNPEVNRFQWRANLNFPHSRHAVQLSSLMAEFFINEGRNSLHQNDVKDEELIYGYTPIYSANFSGYEQAYFF